MYVGRNLDGSVYGVWSQPQPNDADHMHIEELPKTHPDVIAALTPRVSSAGINATDFHAVIADPLVPASLKIVLWQLPDAPKPTVPAAAGIGTA